MYIPAVHACLQFIGMPLTYAVIVYMLAYYHANSVIVNATCFCAVALMLMRVAG